VDSHLSKSLPRLNLIVLRSLEPQRTVDFYTLLGIRFHDEQHGTGPVHWAAELDDLVLEVYPAKSQGEVDRSTRLGFEIENLAAVLPRLRSFGVEIVSEPKPSQSGLRAVVRDPDGRSLELVQSG